MAHKLSVNRLLKLTKYVFALVVILLINKQRNILVYRFNENINNILVLNASNISGTGLYIDNNESNTYETSVFKHIPNSQVC